MSRDISASNLAEIDASHLHSVLMVHLAFDTPVYTHSGIGNIVFDGNTYTGVGDFGSITEANESEVLGPSSLTLTLSGIDSNLISEAQEAGRYKDAVTIYEGYRQDDGTLVDDPWTVWKGWFEYASIQVGVKADISILCHHDLSILDEKDGSRFSAEDQERRYSGDTFFQYVTDQEGLKLNWGGLAIGNTSPGNSDRTRGRHIR